MVSPFGILNVAVSVFDTSEIGSNELVHDHSDSCDIDSWMMYTIDAMIVTIARMSLLRVISQSDRDVD